MVSIVAISLIASIATVGVSAAMACRNRRGQCPGSGGIVRAGGTVYVGDVVQGKKVISALDVGDLEPDRHNPYFQGVQTVTGQHCGMCR